MARVTVLAALPMLGPYTVFQDPGGNYTPSIPDDGLSDDSDATFVDVQQYIGGSGVFLNGVGGVLGAASLAEIGDVTAVYARFRADSPIAGVRLFTIGAGSSSDMDPAGTPIESSLGTLYPMDSEGIGQVHNAVNGYTVDFTVNVPATRTDTTAVTRISEAWIVVAVVRSGVAPPCRLFPREDGLGVGGGRIYPPPRSQQRSGRRFGYY